MEDQSAWAAESWDLCRDHPATSCMTVVTSKGLTFAGCSWPADCVPISSHEPNRSLWDSGPAALFPSEASREDGSQALSRTSAEPHGGRGHPHHIKGGTEARGGCGPSLKRLRAELGLGVCFPDPGHPEHSTESVNRC